nr:uncharacterized protein CI109_001630 [Kwoniella shandongensis]KAA5530223.1 hypothetical protein CI109_001630 [Kwoniella shandongensis]
MIRTRWLRSLNGDPFSPRPKVPGRHCLQAFYAWFHSTSITKAAPLLAESFSPPPSSFHTDLDRCGIAGTHIASPKPLGQVSGGSKISLYPYQRAMIQASLQTLASGKRRFAISAPTGSGKTVVFTHLIPLIPDLSESKAGKVLIMLNKVNLVRQTELAVKRMLGGQYLVELEQSDSKASESADIIIGTVQTLRNPDRLRRFDPADFKLVVVDEAHHSAAPSYLQQLHYFNDEVTLPLDTTPISTHSHGHKVPIIGLSATLNRHDGLALGSVFQTIADSTDCRTLIQEGFLARPEIKQVEAELNLEDSDVNKEGEWKTIALAQKVNKTSVNRIIVRTYLEQATDKVASQMQVMDSSASENSEMTPMNEEEDPSGFTLNYIDISNPFRLASPLLHVVNKVSVNAWVACGEDKYVLGFFDIMSSSKKSLKSSTNTDVQKLLDEEVEMAKLTAGEASAIMTAWIHGRKRTPRSGETRHDQVHKRSEREAVSIQISKSPSPVIETVPDSTGESSMKSDSEPWWKVLRQLLW